MIPAILTAAKAGLAWAGATFIQFGAIGLSICHGYWAGSKMTKWYDTKIAYWKAKKANKEIEELSKTHNEEAIAVTGAVAVAHAN